MCNFARRTVAATVGAIALGCAGIVYAVAADIPQEPPPPQYYGEQEGYIVRPPPTAYIYPRAPVYNHYYAPPPVVVVPPPPYYRRSFYGAGYGYPVYGVRRYAPYIARGYGPYGRYYR
jgi:hypothetical protein